MSQPEALTAKPTQSEFRAALANLYRLQRERQQLQVRRREIDRQLRRLETVMAGEPGFDRLDTLELLHEQAVGCFEDIEFYAAGLRDEIARIVSGMEALESLRPSAARDAFAAYVRTDTEYALSNATATRLDYDHIIAQLRAVH